ncbi:hypothetical protein [Mesorhizobium sp. M1D.F.Ca.ET.043.01.1.1]|uniref:hypothetical protein n=1 Tax=Mesorhizobium sp. M1D.F.Ca.ET.043.01.1.1 TaxID=2493669 RepID=UPI000F756253|nr:hypothetical protein [Mesorhizobium sp. M1D.F.Ca.ET.043.01.1.1]AZO69950.1 hypothetical protein EJ067_01190 [Mesorhizobium sp. M1D.F.Ca.ET.043.01.1.1]
MAGTPVSFKVSDVARAIKGARKGNMEPGRVEIDPVTGRIVVIAAEKTSEPENAVDKWMKNHARSS